MEHVEMIQLYPVEVWCNVPFFPARTPCEGAHVMLSVLPQRWLQMESRSAIWNMLIVYIYILPNSFLIVHICLYHMYIYIYTTWQFVSAVGKSLRWCKCLDDGFPSPKKSSLRQSRFSLGKKCFKPQFGMFFLGSKSLDLWRLWVPVRTGEHKLGSFHFYALTSWLVKGHNCGYTRRDKLKNVSFRCSYDLPTWGLSLNVSTVWIPNSQRFIMAFSL